MNINQIPEPNTVEFHQYQQAIQQRQNSLDNYCSPPSDKSSSREGSVRGTTGSVRFCNSQPSNSFQEDSGYNSDTYLTRNNNTYGLNNIRIHTSAPLKSRTQKDTNFAHSSKGVRSSIAAHSLSLGKLSVAKSRSSNIPIYRRVSHRRATFRNRYSRNRKHLVLKKAEKKPIYSKFYKVNKNIPTTKKQEESSIEELGKKIQDFELK